MLLQAGGTSDDSFISSYLADLRRMASLKFAIRNPQSVIIGSIVAVGIILRLAMYLHNRNLIIDEANIVRNLAERDFAGLVKPLSYEQYAPPVFLWIEKLIAQLFGFGEWAMRLYPLLCGVGALLIFPAIASRFMRWEVLWYPLACFAGGFTFLKYSSEVKQYMPDTFIALALIWLALRTDVGKTRHWRFTLLWMLAGTVAIWSSMPSVFILAGIGCFYAASALRERRYRLLAMLAMIAVVWLSQFGLYYHAILKAQINSQYLQGYHHNYFLIGIPRSLADWQHNWERVEDLLGNIGGWSAVAIVSNLLFLLLGIVQLVKQRSVGIWLMLVPVAFVLLAAALRQFSLIDRVVLFMLPLWLLIIGIGFQWLASYGWRPLQALLVLVGGFNAIAMPHNVLHPYEFHEITKGMMWLQARGARGKQLYLHDASVPAYIYYTELHPEKLRWQP